MTLAAKIAAIHASLDEQSIAHAFGGAVALAWCTERARGTIDIDLNVFVDPSAAETVLAALPEGVSWTGDDMRRLHRDGQARVWWGTTPLDLFFDTTEFHHQAAGRAVVHEFAGAQMPFLSCSDLAVFKAFFDRTKDWADLEEMAEAGTLDVDRVLGVLVRYLGGDDHRLMRLQSLV